VGSIRPSLVRPFFDLAFRIRVGPRAVQEKNNSSSTIRYFMLLHVCVHGLVRHGFWTHVQGCGGDSVFCVMVSGRILHGAEESVLCVCVCVCVCLALASHCPLKSEVARSMHGDLVCLFFRSTCFSFESLRYIVNAVGDGRCGH
jgi:hypothetical protein